MIYFVFNFHNYQNCELLQINQRYYLPYSSTELTYIHIHTFNSLTLFYIYSFLFRFFDPRLQSNGIHFLKFESTIFVSLRMSSACAGLKTWVTC